MVRLLIFLAALALAALGLTWLANNPGVVDLTWRGEEYEVSLMFALAAVLALAVVLAIVWGVLRFVFRVPSLVSIGAQARRRERGFQALSRGMIAVGAGDARAAAKYAFDASRLIAHEPMTKLLQAQSAQLAGDRARAVAAYNAMLQHHETQGLGLRGLHLEARRAGDHAAALQYAMRANARAPAAWAGQAVLDDRTRRGDWAGAAPAAPPPRPPPPASSISRPRTAGARSSRPRWPRRRWSATRRARLRLRRRLAGLRRRLCPRRRSAAGSLGKPVTIAAPAGCSRPLTRRRPIPTSPPPICGSATAIPRRIG